MSLATQPLPADAMALRAFAAELQTELANKDTERARKDIELAANAAEIHAKTLHIEKLKMQLAVLRRARFGRSSEKLDHDIEQLELLLFLKLEKTAPAVASLVTCKHRYARGDRDEFFDDLRTEAKVFENWRYAHEKEFLCSSADTLFVFANAFRSVIKDLHPVMTSSFIHQPSLSDLRNT